jgi:hypothetical protein
VAGTPITKLTGTGVLAAMAPPGTDTGVIVSPCAIALWLSLPTSETLDKETLDVRLVVSVTPTVAAPRVIVGKLMGDPLTQVTRGLTGATTIST